MDKGRGSHVNLLINPGCMVFRGNTPPPLALLYIAAAQGNTVIHDEAVRSKMDLKKVQPRIVGVPIYTKHRHASLNRLREAKAAGAVTVAGGCHVSVMTAQMVEHYGGFIDYFVVGDGELAWKAICAGEDVPQVVQMRVEKLDDLPLPAWHLLDWREYQEIRDSPRISVLLGRGCTGRCTFCLPAGTLISLSGGRGVDIENVKVGDSVATLDGIGLVQETFCREANELIVVELESGKILELTPEHPVLIHDRGWVNANDLQEGDNVIEENL